MNYKTCAKCRRELPINQFYNERKSKDGHYSYCKECCSELHKAYSTANKEKMREISKRSWHKCREARLHGDKIRYDKRHEFLDSLKTPCAKCGEKRVYLLQFHHIDPTKKLFDVGDGTKQHKSQEDVIEESKKCVCLCSNCHKEFHYFYGVKSKDPVGDLQKYLDGVYADGK